MGNTVVGEGRRHSDGVQHWSIHPPSSSQFPQQASFHFQKQFGRTKTGNSAKFVNSGRSPPNLFLSGNYLAVTSGMDATPIQNLQNLHASLDGQRGLWGAIWPRRGNPVGDLCRVVEWGNLDLKVSREREGMLRSLQVVPRAHLIVMGCQFPFEAH